MKKKLVTKARYAEALVVAVLALLIAGTFSYVSRASQNINATYDTTNEVAGSAVPVPSVRSRCTLADKVTAGRAFVDPTFGYSFCIPNGWSLLRFVNSASDAILVGDRTGLTYAASKAPKVTTTTAGTDGQSTLSVAFSDASANVRNMQKIGTFKAGNVTGTIYRKTQTTVPGEFMDAVPKGTVTTSYDLVKDGKGLTLTYVFEPGQTNLSGIMAQIAQTLTF